jgi:hypothetical protein
MYPSDRRYSKEHEWISVDGNSATVGITDYAQDQLGDIVFVELPEVDKSIQKRCSTTSPRRSMATRMASAGTARSDSPTPASSTN